MDLQNINLWS
ncbi:hypothetical protein LINPERHAP1_LOCUS19248 [Linum perenne]